MGKVQPTACDSGTAVGAIGLLGIPTMAKGKKEMIAPNDRCVLHALSCNVLF